MEATSLSRESARPRSLRFVDVGAQPLRLPDWLGVPAEGAVVGPEHRVSPLSPPEVPSHARPALSPLFDSVRPAAMPRPASQLPAALVPSQFPSPITRSPSQYPPGLSSQFPPALDAAFGQEPGQGGAPRDRRRDTLVEDLVPRAEEEAVAAISAAVAQFASERARALSEAERELVQLVKVICRRVVLQEVSSNPLLIENLVLEGIEALGRNDRVTVKLGPFFADSLETISEHLRHQAVDCVVLIDPGVGRHGCQLETELGRVDESIETRLDLLLDGLDRVP